MIKERPHTLLEFIIELITVGFITDAARPFWITFAYHAFCFALMRTIYTFLNFYATRQTFDGFIAYSTFQFYRGFFIRSEAFSTTIDFAATRRDSRFQNASIKRFATMTTNQIRSGFLPDTITYFAAKMMLRACYVFRSSSE